MLARTPGFAFEKQGICCVTNKLHFFFSEVVLTVQTQTLSAHQENTRNQPFQEVPQQMLQSEGVSHIGSVTKTETSVLVQRL